MAISGKRMMSLLKTLGFERLSTYEGEKKAAEILCEEIRTIGLTPVVETFMAPRYTVTNCSLTVTAPFEQSIPCTGYGFSGNDAKDGIEAEFQYIEGFEPIDLQNVKGKIVLITQGLTISGYEALIKAGAVGFIATAGTFRDKLSETDLDERMLRDKHTEHGKLPGVCIRVKDALSLIPKHPTRVRLTLAQEEGEAESQNVICEIKGSTYPDEVVIYTAHYDTVRFSKGFFDNSTGSAMVMELIRHYHENPPKRTVRFVFCGSEERGLLGSKAYVAAHEEELSNIRLCINLDMAGPILGKEMANVTGEEALCHALSFIYKEAGYPMVVRQDIYSSDSIPFADKGIPGINFFRAASPGTSQIHCRYDVIDILSGESLAKTTKFVAYFSDRVINAAFFPIERKMPDNMVEKIDRYLLKKKNS
ncbi:MAG: M20/M25/M40 family metallo-hydrolase [Clostridia bacterium]|nr:M20/M25/M40 family metallo-hydrolase [Clostridia bacterium]